MGFQSEHTFSYVLFFHFDTSPFKKKNEIQVIIEHLLAKSFPGICAAIKTNKQQQQTRTCPAF